MKAYSKIGALLMMLVFAAASGSAMAQHGGHGGYGHGGYSHGGGYGHGGGWGWGVGLGLALGLPLLWSGYYAPYAYPAPTYAYPAPVYAYPAPAYTYPAPSAQQGYVQAAPAQTQDWYFCAGSNAYYPYVRECPGGWQRVPSVPPR